MADSFKLAHVESVGKLLLPFVVDHIRGRTPDLLRGRLLTASASRKDAGDITIPKIQ